MNQSCTYLILCLAFILSSCLRLVDLTPSIYYEASGRHHELADRGVAASNEEWTSLIEAFKQVIAADPHGAWADDAQYAIASCWIWLARKGDSGSTQHAVDALEKVLGDYPDSPLRAEAHYWLGHCHGQRGDDNLATMHYQAVINDHFDRTTSERAQLQLAQLYEKQSHFPAAIAAYQSLVERSEDSQTVAQAEIRVSSLQSKTVLPDPSEVKTDGITVLTPVDIPSEQIALTTPSAELLLMKDIQTTVTVLEKTDETVETINLPNAQSEVSKTVETVDLPSVEINSTIRATNKNGATELRENDAHGWNGMVPAGNSDVETAADLSLARQLGLGVNTIIIDPGHGGEDPGSVSHSWTQEKFVALELSSMLRDLLIDGGYKVRLTRDVDTYLSLKARTDFATMQGADLFISIHANASANIGASGIETYYLALASDESAQTTAARENIGVGYSIKELDTLMAQILRESKSVESLRLAEFVQDELINATDAIDRGIRHAPFVVLIGTKVPAILIEVGFLSHTTEAEKLTTEPYQRSIAAAIARGIEQYASSIPVTTGRADRQIGE